MHFFRRGKSIRNFYKNRQLLEEKKDERIRLKYSPRHGISRPSCTPMLAWIFSSQGRKVAILRPSRDRRARGCKALYPCNKHCYCQVLSFTSTLSIVSAQVRDKELTTVNER